jgi:hypothetical protein
VFFWERQEVDWGIVTELEVPKDMAHDIAYIHGYSNLLVIEGFENIHIEELENMSIYFIRLLLEAKQTIRQIASDFDHNFGMSSGCGLSLFKHLLMTKVIEIDMAPKLDVNQQLNVKYVRRDFSKKVEAV